MWPEKPKSTAESEGKRFRLVISAFTVLLPGAEITCPASGITFAGGIRFRKVLFGYFLFKEKVTTPNPVEGWLFFFPLVFEKKWERKLSELQRLSRS